MKTEKAELRRNAGGIQSLSGAEKRMSPPGDMDSFTYESNLQPIGSIDQNLRGRSRVKKNWADGTICVEKIFFCIFSKIILVAVVFAIFTIISMG
ncbi:hypothetical protein TNIN_84281 [Trichonephila inaurata madagascariensis]|uniref:Uncharacterized protein n=1 Tax=Trichonephila inaurata madagascariensis TaxID=2747483 RepID=A0A8X7C1G4_9ARAC|nr:hypothetical protein TNIN_84281 [Trichonephila inaurata madagascariensis]